MTTGTAKEAMALVGCAVVAWALACTPAAAAPPQNLAGTWRFMPADDPTYALPGYDDSAWAVLPVPGLWHSHGVRYDGVAWYRRSVTLAPEVAASVAILPPAVLFAYELYLNGHKICGFGRIAANGALVERGIGHRICRVPPQVARAGTNVVAVRVRSEFGFGGFEFNGFHTGTHTAVERLQSRRFIHYAAIASALAMFGLYHLVLFAGRTRERAYLYLSVLSVALAGYVAGIKGLALLWTDSFWLNFELFYAAIALAPWGISGFYYALYDLKPGRALRFAIPLTLANVAVLATVPFSEWVYANVYPLWFPVMSLVTMAYTLLAVVLTARAVRLRRLGARLALVGFGVMGFTICHDILVRQGFLHNSTIAEDGYLAWMITLAAAMALKVAKLHNDTDKLNVELAQAVDRITNTAQAIRRFVPDPFLHILKRTDLTEVRAGDSVLTEMAVMFADIRGFTGLAQQLDAPATFALLNRYLAAAVPVIEANGGFVDKYLGDGIMALFANRADGRPAAMCALAAAMAMRDKLAALRQRMPQAAALDIGVGIHAGPLMLGTVGSSTRLDTTAIGDTVNIAARIESLNRMYGARLLISQAVFDHLTPDMRLGVREIDLVRVMGAGTPVRLFEVIAADPPHLVAQKHAAANAFAQGVAAFRGGAFARADTVFATAAVAAPNDPVVALYGERCRDLMARPPADWTGVMDLKHK